MVKLVNSFTAFEKSEKNCLLLSAYAEWYFNIVISWTINTNRYMVYLLGPIRGSIMEFTFDNCPILDLTNIVPDFDRACLRFGKKDQETLCGAF